jgi:hypothetical protein
MKDENVYLEQAGLKSLGFDPGALDGDEGPKTLAAKSAWRGSLGSAAASAAGTPGEIAARMVALAQGELAVRESSSNQGAGIRKYWTATSYAGGYDNREPHCAAFVCWLVATAASAAGRGHAFGLPQSPVAFDFLAWAKANAGKGVALVDAQGGAALMPGDIVVFAFSHAGVVEKASAAGSGSGVATIEANTDPDSTDGEGGGVYRRSRSRGVMKGVVRIFS